MSQRRSDIDAPDVFAYLDYREYLRDYYELRKATSQFSYRVFARRAKLKSQNYLKLVIDGERNLTDSMAARFAESCRLSGKAAEFFVALVKFCQAKGAEERETHYRRLRRFQRYRAEHQMSAAQDAYHSKWYLSALRELVTTKGFREDPTWIAERLLPRISPHQAETAIRTLLQLGLLKRDVRGRLRQAEPVVTTGADRVQSLHVRAFHRSMLQQAASSMDRLPATRRDISSVTLKLGSDGIQLVKERLAALRRDLIDLAESQKRPTQVVHVGLQAFPLSRTEEDDE